MDITAQAFWALSGHFQLMFFFFFIHQYSQFLLCGASVNEFIPQSILILRTALTQVQDLTLVLAELHEVHISMFATGMVRPTELANHKIAPNL